MVKKIIFMSILCLMFGCASQPSYNQLAMKLQMNMAKQDVLNLLGEPKKVSARNTDKGFVETLNYWGKSMIGFTIVDDQMLSQDRLSVTLVNNKVVSWGDRLDMGEMMERTHEITSETIKQTTETIRNIHKK